MKDKKDLKILLLQFRDPVMGKHEYTRFTNKTDFSLDQIDPFDVLENTPSVDMLNDYDALVLGGSGDYCLSEGNLPHYKETMEVIREAQARKMPILGLCFGLHLLVEANGGELVSDKDNKETGTYKIDVLPEGENDLIMSNLPKTFDAVVGRKDSVVRLPEGAINMAKSEKCSVHAVKFAGDNIYAFQFHPELNQQDMIERVEFYLDLYMDDDPEKFQKMIDDSVETPEAPRVIQLFFDKIVCG